MACKVFRAMFIRSLDANQNRFMASTEMHTNAMTEFGLDTSVDMHLQTMNY